MAFNNKVFNDKDILYSQMLLQWFISEENVGRKLELYLVHWMVASLIVPQEFWLVFVDGDFVSGRANEVSISQRAIFFSFRTICN